MFTVKESGQCVVLHQQCPGELSGELSVQHLKEKREVELKKRERGSYLKSTWFKQ